MSPPRGLGSRNGELRVMPAPILHSLSLAGDEEEVHAIKEGGRFNSRGGAGGKDEPLCRSQGHDWSNALGYGSTNNGRLPEHRTERAISLARRSPPASGIVRLAPMG